MAESDKETDSFPGGPADSEAKGWRSFCSRCGESMDGRALTCPHCGHDTRTNPLPPPPQPLGSMTPATAARILSLVGIYISAISVMFAAHNLVVQDFGVDRKLDSHALEVTGRITLAARQILWSGKTGFCSFRYEYVVNDTRHRGVSHTIGDDIRWPAEVVPVEIEYLASAPSLSRIKGCAHSAYSLPLLVAVLVFGLLVGGLSVLSLTRHGLFNRRFFIEPAGPWNWRYLLLSLVLAAFLNVFFCSMSDGELRMKFTRWFAALFALRYLYAAVTREKNRLWIMYSSINLLQLPLFEFLCAFHYYSRNVHALYPNTLAWVTGTMNMFLIRAIPQAW